MDGLAGGTVLITGGGSGIGLATARRLVAADARVVLVGRSAERLTKAAADLQPADRVLTVAADVTRLDELDRVVEQVDNRFGGLSGVFANAGVALFHRTPDVTEDVYEQVLGTNFKGAYFTVQKALPLLDVGASIVFNGSWLVHRGLPFTALYAASKAAVVNLARTLAADLADRRIRVNAVSPGYTVTDMFLSIANREEEREAARQQVVLGRLGDAQDVADAVLFLLSNRSSYVTGQELLVDGGLIPSTGA